MYKKGYKHMLEDIKDAAVTINKFKGGYSIFEVEKLRSQLLNTTDAPVISNDALKNDLSRVITSPRINKQGDLKSNLQQINAINDAQAVSTCMS
jgi:hypothetical protein